MKLSYRDYLGILGLALVVYGIATWSRAGGLVTAGVMLFAIAVKLDAAAAKSSKSSRKED